MMHLGKKGGRSKLVVLDISHFDATAMQRTFLVTLKDPVVRGMMMEGRPKIFRQDTSCTPIILHL
jgi:hypothetical protein